MLEGLQALAQVALARLGGGGGARVWCSFAQCVLWFAKALPSSQPGLTR